MPENHIANLTKNSIIYGIGSISVQLVAFILLPVYTNYLSPSEFGVLEILRTTAALLNIVLVMGFSSALFKTYYTVESPDERERLISTTYIFISISSAVIISFMLLISPMISRIIFLQSNYGNYFRLIFLSLFFEVGIVVYLSVLRAKEKAKKYSIVAFSRMFLLMGLSILFVVYYKLSIKGILLAMLISTSIVYLYSVRSIWSSVSYGFNVKELKSMLKYGLPLVPAGLASMLLSVSDRYILQGLVSPSDLGIYSLGYRLGMIVQVLIIGPFTIAWGPFLWAVSSQNEAKAIYASVLKYFLAISLFVSLTVSLFAKEIVNLIAVPEYLNAFKIVPYVTISYVFYGLYYVFSPGINLQSKTKYLPFIVGASALINIVLNYQLIPVYGIMGAAASTSIAYLLLPIGTYFASRRYYPISYNWVQVSKIGLIYILCLWIPRVLDNQMDQYELVLKILLVIGFPAVLYLVKYIDKNDVHQIRKMVG